MSPEQKPPYAAPPAEASAAPSRHLPRSGLEEICATYGLAVGQQFWASLAAVPAESPLVTYSAQDEPRLAIDALHTTLEQMYREGAQPKWKGIGRKSAYTLNILTSHFAGPARRRVQAPPSSDIAGVHYVAPDVVAAFSQREGLDTSSTLAQSSIARIGERLLHERYGVHNGLLPIGRYTADDISYRIVRGDSGRHETKALQVGLRSMQGALRSPDTAYEAHLTPRMHYTLLRFMSAFRGPHSVLARQTERQAPPSHPSIGDAFKPGTVSVADAHDALAHYTEYSRSGLGDSYLVQDALRKAECEVYYPLTGLLDTVPETATQAADAWISRARTCRFLTNVLRSGGDGRSTLITSRQFAVLAGLDARHGAYEELPNAEYTAADWTDQPVLALRALRSFAANFGRDIAADDLQRLVDTTISAAQWRHKKSEGIAAYRLGHTYQEEDAVFTITQEHPEHAIFQQLRVRVLAATIRGVLEHYGAVPAPSIPTILAVGKYLKAARQQGVREFVS